MKRSKFIKFLMILILPLRSISQVLSESLSSVKGNYWEVYTNIHLKSEFFFFLKTVFNLYPEKQYHELISEVTLDKEGDKEGDKEIYLEIQSKQDDLSSMFSLFTYQLPALLRQKNEMAKQAVALLGENTNFDGYLEIGSSGRYLDYLEEEVNITGNRYYADGKEPGYSIQEMIDRGQISIGAEYIPMADYRTMYSDLISHESLDLVTVYIGFHHCPLDLRIPFISSIRDTLRPNGKLILRDHDCNTKDQTVIVALAHDVFNMGTNETWEYNEKELRNFYSLDFIIEFVEKIGFKFQERTLFQEGDPTKNALMLFHKI